MERPHQDLLNGKNRPTGSSGVETTTQCPVVATGFFGFDRLQPTHRIASAGISPSPDGGKTHKKLES